MKKIDSDALGILNRSLGLSGIGSPVTELEDGIVDQTLSVNDIARRGRSLAATEGIFVWRLRNAHTDATSTTSTINPFAVGTTLAHPPYPSPMPAQFDVWLLKATLRRVSGTGTLSAALHLNMPAHVVGISVQGVGSLGIGITSHTIAFWDAVAVENVGFGILNQGGTMANLGYRLPRSATTQVVFATTSSATSVYDLLITAGVFPIALGQDAVV